MASKKKNKKRKDDLQGWIFIVLGVAIFSGIVVFYNLNKSNHHDRSENLCRNDGFVTKENLVLIDATDSYNPSQRLYMEKFIKSLLTNSTKDERISLFVLHENKDEFSPVVSVCNPGDGKDSNALIENKKKIEKAWENDFFKTVTNEVTKLADLKSAKKSPILEMLKYSSIHSLYESSAENKRVILISDMLIHSDQFSQYDNPSIRFSEVKNTQYFKSSMPNFFGAEVEVLYIVRPSTAHLQNRGHVRFWEELISYANGSLIRVEKVN